MPQLFQAIISTAPSPPPVPEGILAFRSITTLTSIIQQGPFSDLSDRKITAEAGRRELILSVAFSILAALEREVVAVVAKQRAEGLEVIACSNIPHDKDRTFLRHVGGIIDSMFSSRNDRRSDMLVGQTKKSDYPSIIRTSPPSGLKGNSSAKELREYIDTLCEDNAAGVSPHLRFPLPQHLDVLRQLLSARSSRPQVAKDMLRYVVATSYVKMNNRMQKSFSKAYLDTLTAMSIDNLGSTVAQPTDKSKATKDRSFLLYLAELTGEWRRKFPALYELGTRAKQAAATGGSSEDFRLYSTDTRAQFHGLFIMCLQEFAKGLRELAKIRQPADSMQSEDAKDKTGKRFQLFTNSVIRHGDCLQKLARTHALQLHLHAVLSHHQGPSLASTSTLMPELGNDDIVPGQDEIEPLLTDTDMLPLAKPYSDWLKLIIAEFDAADALIYHFVVTLRQSTQIFIKVVTPPPANSASLPWKDLFQSSSSSYILDTRGGGMSNAQLLQFLINVESALPAASKWLKKFRDLWKSRNVNKMLAMIKAQGVMKQYQEEMQRLDEQEERLWWQFWLQAPNQPLLLPDWPPTLSKLANALAGWSFASPRPEAEIQECLKSLEESAEFFQRIANTNRIDGFAGTIHCEACLASLITASATESVDTNAYYQEVLAGTKDLGDVIGVSKRCCPACASLLKHLMHKKGALCTRGSHNTVSPCSLPIWLPEGVVAHLNHDLGALLRKELVGLIMAPESHRKCAISTGSSGRSLDSEEDEPIIMDFSAEEELMGMLGM